MPGLGGLDVLAVLRCSKWDTPVILVTAFSDAEARLEADDLGASAFLAKPLSARALRRAVERAVTIGTTRYTP
jgi:two-component system response regulator AtoC